MKKAKNITVVFDELPKEAYLIRLYRKYFGRPMPNKIVQLGMNGRNHFFLRGVEIKLSAEKANLLKVADSSLPHMLYGYKVIND